MEECLETLRNQMYSVMNAKNWSMVRLAVECNLPYDTLISIFYGRTKDIRLSTLLRISEGLGVPVLRLIDKDEKARSENETVLRNVYLELRRQLKRNGIMV